MRWIPVNGIIMKISGRIKPEIKLLLPVAYSFGVYIGVDNVWLP